MSREYAIRLGLDRASQTGLWLSDSCLEYDNGCVPSPTHRGWSKCAPGSKPGIRLGNADSDAFPSRWGDGVDDMPAGTRDLAAYLRSGKARDPSTFRRPDGKFGPFGVLGTDDVKCTRPDGSIGQPGFLRGQSKCCKHGDCTA